MKRSEKIYGVLDIIAWGFFDHVEQKWKRGITRFVGYLIALPIFAMTTPIQAVLFLAMTVCEMWEEANKP